MTIVVRFWRTVSIASLDLKFGEGIEGGRGFVQKENPGVLEQRADEGDPLAFPTRQQDAALADLRVVAFRLFLRENIETA